MNSEREFWMIRTESVRMITKKVSGMGFLSVDAWAFPYVHYTAPSFWEFVPNSVSQSVWWMPFTTWVTVWRGGRGNWSIVIV